jgi:NAD(P)-dependent dehydrogenase (short-subunit alcohol dehydrogenase family)
MVKSMLGQGHRVFAGQFMPEWSELTGLKALYPKVLTAVPLDVGSIESAKAAARIVEKEAEALDVIIHNAGIIGKYEDAHIRDGQNYEAILRQFDINALGALRVMEAFIKLMDRGSGKRLCFVSSEAGSVGANRRTGWFGYCMSKCALNMAVASLFNDLRPNGYTFRLYHPGWMRTYMHGEKNLAADLEPDEAAASALNYFLSESGVIDESRLVLRDNLGKEWPW